MLARGYAKRLLGLLGVEPPDDRMLGSTTTSYQGWAASGAMMLTGEKDGPPRAPGWPVAPAMAGAASALAFITERLGCRVDVDGPALLGERAAHTGLRRRGGRLPALWPIVAGRRLDARRGGMDAR